jgi:hypothetical protein
MLALRMRRLVVRAFARLARNEPPEVRETRRRLLTGLAPPSAADCFVCQWT